MLEGISLVCAGQSRPLELAPSADVLRVLPHFAKNSSLTAALSVGVDEMQRNFDAMRMQVEAWRESQIPNATAKLIIYRAFIESDLEVPRHLARPVHDLYFNPQHEGERGQCRGHCGGAVSRESVLARYAPWSFEPNARARRCRGSRWSCRMARFRQTQIPCTHGSGP